MPLDSPFEILVFEDGWCPDKPLLDYVKFWRRCCFNCYEREKDVRTSIEQAHARDDPQTLSLVRAGAEAGDPIDILEWGMRLYNGFRVEKDRDAALKQWMRITDASTRATLSSPPHRRVLSAAYACISSYYSTKCHLPQHTLQIDDLRRAAEAVNECAKLQMIPAALVELANYIDDELRNYGFRYMPQFTCLEHMWIMYAPIARDIEKKQQERERKVAKAPNAYRCAAPGCNILGTKKKALQRCAGVCEGINKPHYCSKTCQTKDWKRHKPFCKAGAAEDPDAVPAPDDSGADEHSLCEPFVQPPRPDKERIIQIPAPHLPGGSYQITSSTMSPELMRAFREKIIAHNIEDEKNRPW
ncbi:hypothetical protein EVJ58_g6263 [Rhodofomes roseus]|uniref:MYND-type domain-containing protein n=1 Tax=Rhodofomes roseus TaxID=34475 RepID=A0A4Y9Y9V4_9APHY|nr:hypothetical protein EVJ58_g6263 [Rhodofomes roseus]